jgi:hypothetical protein
MLVTGIDGFYFALMLVEDSMQMLPQFVARPFRDVTNMNK